MKSDSERSASATYACVAHTLCGGGLTPCPSSQGEAEEEATPSAAAAGGALSSSKLQERAKRFGSAPPAKALVSEDKKTQRAARFQVRNTPPFLALTLTLFVCQTPAGSTAAMTEAAAALAASPAFDAKKAERAARFKKEFDAKQTERAEFDAKQAERAARFKK